MSAAIPVLRVLLLAATAAMFVVHLFTRVLLARGIRPIVLLRFEAGYYAALAAALANPAFRSALVPVIVLGTIHLAAWAYSEHRRHPAALSGGALAAVQVFDWAEALALVWIAMLLR